MAQDRFRELLEDIHEWPTYYTFKFVVPKDQVAAVKALFNPGSTTSRPSKTGKYESLTAKVLMQTANDVIALYDKAAEIEGLIAL